MNILFLVLYLDPIQYYYFTEASHPIGDIISVLVLRKAQNHPNGPEAPKGHQKHPKRSKRNAPRDPGGCQKPKKAHKKTFSFFSNCDIYQRVLALISLGGITSTSLSKVGQSASVPKVPLRQVVSRRNKRAISVKRKKCLVISSSKEEEEEEEEEEEDEEEDEKEEGEKEEEKG
jgi:hypothetical protein